jgi:hypothetical protein
VRGPNLHRARGPPWCLRRVWGRVNGDAFVVERSVRLRNGRTSDAKLSLEIGGQDYTQQAIEWVPPVALPIAAGGCQSASKDSLLGSKCTRGCRRTGEKGTWHAPCAHRVKVLTGVL